MCTCVFVKSKKETRQQEARRLLLIRSSCVAYILRLFVRHHFILVLKGKNYSGHAKRLKSSHLRTTDCRSSKHNFTSYLKLHLCKFQSNCINLTPMYNCPGTIQQTQKKCSWQTHPKTTNKSRELYLGTWMGRKKGNMLQPEKYFKQWRSANHHPAHLF